MTAVHVCIQWVGYIKDYDGGTLMECVIVQRLPHTRLPAMLQAQKQALDSRIRQYSKSHVVHDGLSAFQEGCRRVDISSIPGRGSRSRCTLQAAVETGHPVFSVWLFLLGSLSVFCATMQDVPSCNAIRGSFCGHVK